MNCIRTGLILVWLFEFSGGTIGAVFLDGLIGGLGRYRVRAVRGGQ